MLSDRSVVDSVILRPYQAKALGRILACQDRGVRRALVVMPTGTGKTTLFSALAGEFHRQSGGSCLVLAHRRELLTQAAHRIRQQNPQLKVAIESDLGRLRADEQDVLIGSVQSLGRPGTRRLDLLRPGCLIIDEAHHGAAESYQNVMKAVGAYEDRCFTIGVTATPHRMDNRPLHGEEEAIFQEVAFTYTLTEAIKDGWLADLKGFRVATGIDLSKVRVVRGDYSAKQLQDATNTEARNNVALENWLRIARDRKTIVFCTGVAHANTVAELFRHHGISAEAVNGEMEASQREGIMRRFLSGRTQVLTNVEIATEGFDVPDAGCVLLLRPTKSWALFCQMIGRGLRVLPNTIEGLADTDARLSAIRASDKPDCIVIDVVDNGKRVRMPSAEKEEIPSVAGIVGLPEDLDLEGHTILEALQKWEKLDPRAQAHMFRRNVNFDDLDETLVAVDLLAELTPPDEVSSVSQNAWMKIGDGRYLLVVGSGQGEHHRMALLEEDALGFCHLSLSSSERGATEFECGRELPLAFKRADGHVRERWPFTRGFTLAQNRWRNAPVTTEQKIELEAMGVNASTLSVLDNAGQAWTLLELRRKELGK